MNNPLDLLNNDSANSLDSVLSKIEKAKLYEALLHQPLFDENCENSEIVQEVTQEVRQFIVNRLTALMGSQSEALAYAPQFSDKQVEVLKIIADSVLSKTQKPSQPPNYLVRTVETKSVTVKPKSSSRRKNTSNVSEKTGQDYSQAVNPNNRPMPMPSQDQMNFQNAASVSKNQIVGGGGNDLSQLITTAINMSINKNKDVQED